MEFTPILKILSSQFPESLNTKKTVFQSNILIISPHPDDECIMSSLALRMKLENKSKIINVAVTLGSKEERKSERLTELQNACNELKFELEVLPENWNKKSVELKKLIKKYKPFLIIAPHLNDFHPTHVKTAILVKKTLKNIRNQNLMIAWSEYWGQLKRPNLLLQVPSEILLLQLKGLTHHVGEISRNPYHIRLPGWMMDNVRRGSEIIKGNNRRSPKINFGMIYQLQIYQNNKLKDLIHFPYLSSDQDLGQIFKLIFEAASGSKTTQNRG